MPPSATAGWALFRWARDAVGPSVIAAQLVETEAGAGRTARTQPFALLATCGGDETAAILGRFVGASMKCAGCVHHRHGRKADDRRVQHTCPQNGQPMAVPALVARPSSGHFIAL